MTLMKILLLENSKTKKYEKRFWIKGFNKNVN